MKRPVRTRIGNSREQGFAAVEFAMVVPILVVLVALIVELGALYMSAMTVTSASRTGARVASAFSTSRLADYTALQNVSSALRRFGPSQIDYVSIYKPIDAYGTPASTCTGASATSTAGACNVYSGATLGTFTLAQFTGTTSCTGTSPDRFWCPIGRDSTQTGGTDSIGVLVRVRHLYLTKIFNFATGASRVYRTTTVMKLEPM